MVEICTQWGDPLLTECGISGFYYLDKATLTILAYEPPINEADFLEVNDGEGTPHGDKCLKAWWTNAISKANPDWQPLYDLSTAIVHAGVSGGGNPIDPGITAVLVDHIANYDNLNLWWGSSSFRKYGLFAWGASYSSMPVFFINLSPCSFFFYDTTLGADGFMFSLAPNVTCTFTSYQPTKPPQNEFNGLVIGVPTW